MSNPTPLERKAIALGIVMDRAYQSKRTGNETGDEKRISCSACAAEPSLFVLLLDSRSGKQHRLFKCECGEIVWDDKAYF